MWCVSWSSGLLSRPEEDGGGVGGGVVRGHGMAFDFWEGEVVEVLV